MVRSADRVFNHSRYQSIDLPPSQMMATSQNFYRNFHQQSEAVGNRSCVQQYPPQMQYVPRLPNFGTSSASVQNYVPSSNLYDPYARDFNIGRPAVHQRLHSSDDFLGHPRQGRECYSALGGTYQPQIDPYALGKLTPCLNQRPLEGQRSTYQRNINNAVRTDSSYPCQPWSVSHHPPHHHPRSLSNASPFAQDPMRSDYESYYSGQVSNDSQHFRSARL